MLCVGLFLWLALEFALLGYHAPFQVIAGFQGLPALSLLILYSVGSYYCEIEEAP